MEKSKESRARVFGAADALFEQAGNSGFPTVDAVRRAARVSMSDASAGMREWRRLKAAQSATETEHVPEAIQSAATQAVAVLWRQAQGLASDVLRTAHAKTEGELQDTLQREMVEAFERQSAELEAVTTALAAEKATTEKLNQELAAIRKEVRDATSRADKAEARNVEIERRAEELRAERDQAMEAAAKARDEAAGLRGRLEAADMLGLISK